MRTASLGILAAVCLSIDLLRQRHMKYKAEQIVIINKCVRSCGFDPRKLSARDKFLVISNLGINLFLSDFE